EPFVDMFSQMKAPLGIFSVLGNHDYGDYQAWPSPEDKAANFEHLKDIHRRLGWDLLLNENRSIQVGEATLRVLGVENYSAHPRFPKYGDLAKAAEGITPDSLNILLSHDPSHWDDEVTTGYPDVHLTLSGHTH